MKQVNVGSTLIVKNDKFLLVNSKTGPARGQWNNPGGRLEEGESFEEAARRETLEETGLSVKIGRLVNTYYFQESSENLVTKKVFEGHILGGNLNPPSDEIEQLRWFSHEEIMDDLRFTFGAVYSVKDFLASRFGVSYKPNRIA